MNDFLRIAIRRIQLALLNSLDLLMLEIFQSF